MQEHSRPRAKCEFLAIAGPSYMTDTDLYQACPRHPPTKYSIQRPLHTANLYPNLAPVLAEAIASTPPSRTPAAFELCLRNLIELKYHTQGFTLLVGRTFLPKERWEVTAVSLVDSVFLQLTLAPL